MLSALFNLWLVFMLRPACPADVVVRYEASHQAMGTIFTVAAYGEDQAHLAEVVNAVFEEIDSLDEQMSNYRPESELSAINREAAQGDVIVEPKLFRLVQESIRYSEETGGAFDPTVGPLMKHWGFFRGHGRLPTETEIAQILKSVGYQRVKLDPGRRTIRFEARGVELDLGGIAKGYAVDRAVELLRSNDITSALVSSGTSSIYALGSPPGDRGWKVTVRDPYDPQKAGDVFRLQNHSLSTSGSYEKFFKLDGKIYCHIMNPHTGWPVENMLSTAVLAPTTTQSDALSTSFFVLGVDGTRKYLAIHPNLQAVFYLPEASKANFSRVVVRSNSFSLSPDVLADIQR